MSDDVAARIEWLAQEQEAASTEPQRALLCFESAVLRERAGDEAGAARDFLSSYNADPGFREPIEALAALLERRKSFKNLGKLLEALARAATTPEQGARACDVEARTRLGPRRSSVFPCPPRGVLGAVDSGEALARSRAIDGRGISRQAFHLLPRIAELDGGLTPALQSRVFECHPESCFVSLAGAPLESKHTAQGREMRCRLLTAVVPDTEALVAGPPRGAGVADVLDAAVVAWTARRWRAGRALVLGDDRRDRRGLRMQIVC